MRHAVEDAEGKTENANAERQRREWGALHLVDWATRPSTTRHQAVRGDRFWSRRTAAPSTSRQSWEEGAYLLIR